MVSYKYIRLYLCGCTFVQSLIPIWSGSTILSFDVLLSFKIYLGSNSLKSINSMSIFSGNGPSKWKKSGKINEKKMFVLWRRIVETKNPVIIKKKTTSTSTSKNKTKLTAKKPHKNNKYSPAHSLSKDHQAKTIKLLRLIQAFLDPPTTRYES